MARARNTQRKRYYNATSIMKSLERPLTETEIRNLVFSAPNRKFLTSRYPEVKRPFMGKFFGGKIRGERTYVGIPTTCHTNWYASWAVAQLIWKRRDWREEQAWHGWEFCAVLIDVVHAFMGKVAADTLRESFKLHGVRFKPKRKRKVTPEMLEHLAAARAKMKGGVE